MIEDARARNSESNIDTDLCIIGAGAAGIALALEFANTATRVCVIESGGLELEIATQDLNAGTSIGWPYWPLAASRVRFFGGTTNHWGGVSLPLSPEDFATKSWQSNSGWPLSFSELAPFYERAQPILGLQTPLQRFPDEATKVFQPLWNNDSIVSRFSRDAKHRRFGLHFRAAIEAAPNIQLLLNANAVDAALEPGTNKLNSLGISCLQGADFKVHAKTFVLATGGIENARWLLSANPNGAGIGNSNDLVGRYFSDHPYFSNLAKLQIFDDALDVSGYAQTRDVAGDRTSMHLEVSPALQASKQLMTARIHLSQAKWRAFQKDRGAPEQNLSDRIANRVQNLLGSDKDSNRSNRPEDHGLPPQTRLFAVGAWQEVIPRFESRVTLGEQRDALGIQRPQLDWKIGDEEKTSLIGSLQALGRMISAKGQGRIRIDLDEESPWPWEGGYEPGLHQMGTTRMSVSAKNGVVDANCQMHEVQNMFIAGSSVFPTYGVANPTMTILALSLRLADHLKRNHLS